MVRVLAGLAVDRLDHQGRLVVRDRDVRRLPGPVGVQAVCPVPQQRHGHPFVALDVVVIDRHDREIDARLAGRNGDRAPVRVQARDRKVAAAQAGPAADAQLDGQGLRARALAGDAQAGVVPVLAGLAVGRLDHEGRLVVGDRGMRRLPCPVGVQRVRPVPQQRRRHRFVALDRGVVDRRQDHVDEVLSVRDRRGAGERIEVLPAAGLARDAVLHGDVAFGAVALDAERRRVPALLRGVAVERAHTDRVASGHRVDQQGQAGILLPPEAAVGHDQDVARAIEGADHHAAFGEARFGHTYVEGDTAVGCAAVRAVDIDRAVEALHRCGEPAVHERCRADVGHAEEVVTAAERVGIGTLRPLHADDQPSVLIERGVLVGEHEHVAGLVEAADQLRPGIVAVVAGHGDGQAAVVRDRGIRSRPNRVGAVDALDRAADAAVGGDGDLGAEVGPGHVPVAGEVGEAERAARGLHERQQVLGLDREVVVAPHPHVAAAGQCETAAG